MSEWNRGQVSIKLTDGTQVNEFLSFSLTDTFTDPMGSYSFEIQPLRKDISRLNRAIQKGDLIGVTINGTGQGAFIIQTKKTTIGKEQGVKFDLMCNTVLVTPNEGSVDPDVAETFQSDTPVAEVILSVLRLYGFSAIVTDATSDVEALTGKPLDGRKAAFRLEELKHKEAKAQDNESAYAFCARIFGRLGLALRVTADGTLLLTSPDYDQLALYQVEQSSILTKQGDAVIGEVEIADTNANQFSEMVMRGTEKDEKGQKRAGRPAHRLRIKGFADPSLGDAPFEDEQTSTIEPGRHSYKSSVAIYKPAYRLDKFSRDNDFCKERAHRFIGRRAESGYVVKATVDGLIATSGAIWTVDTIARVKIEQAELDEDMWILSTTKTMDRTNAQKTALTLIPKGSLILGVQ